MEKTKSKKGKKIVKGVLLALSFVLTAVITFSVTLAWFYDDDWASNMVTMAGTVGIQLRNSAGTHTTGAGNLNFMITTEKAYPGQAIDVQASVYNDGGASGEDDGSEAYIRAKFVVYTNIGNGLEEGSQDPEALLSSRAIYDYLLSMITTANTTAETAAGTTPADTSLYTWQYYETPAAMKLKNADSSATVRWYYDGTGYPSEPTITKTGYYYLCYPQGANYVENKAGTATTINNKKVLKPLKISTSAAFLFDSEFIIPWTLTNASADKLIFVAVQFQAVQTFIPLVEASTGTILPGTNGDNQVDPTECTYDNDGVQTVFNSSNFGAIDLKIYEKDGEGNNTNVVLADFSDTSKYNSTTGQNAYTDETV